MTHSRYCEKWEVESAYVAVGLLATHQLNVLSGAQVFQNYLSSILQIWILCRLQNLIQKVCQSWLKMSEIDFWSEPPHITIPPTDIAEHFTSPKKNPIWLNIELFHIV